MMVELLRRFRPATPGLFWLAFIASVLGDGGVPKWCRNTGDPPHPGPARRLPVTMPDHRRAAWRGHHDSWYRHRHAHPARALCERGAALGRSRFRPSRWWIASLRCWCARCCTRCSAAASSASRCRPSSQNQRLQPTTWAFRSSGSTAWWGLAAGVAAIAGCCSHPSPSCTLTWASSASRPSLPRWWAASAFARRHHRRGLVIGVVEALAGFYPPEGFKDIAPYIVVLIMLVLKLQWPVRREAAQKSESHTHSSTASEPRTTPGAPCDSSSNRLRPGHPPGQTWRPCVLVIFAARPGAGRAVAHVRVRARAALSSC